MPQDTTPETTPHPIFLSDEPAKLASYIHHRKSTAMATTADGDTNPAPPYNFADFVSEMNMTDFNDPWQIRATLESQAHLLGTAFNYLMLDGDWKNLQHFLRAQKVMRDTMELMNHYPPLTYWPPTNQPVSEPTTEDKNASMD